MKPQLLMLLGLVTFALPVFSSIGQAAGKPFMLRGTVIGRGGLPVEGGSLGMDGRMKFGPIQAGRFELPIERVEPGPQVEPGPHWASFCKDNLLILKIFNVAAGQTEAEVSFRIGESPAVMGRVVTDDMPDGVPNARVSFSGSPAGRQNFNGWVTVANDGTFELDGEGLQGCRIQAVVPYHLPNEEHRLPGEWLEIKPPFPMKVELRPPPDTVIFGRVVQEGWIPTRPVPHAVVMFASSERIGYATAADDGRFEITGLDPANYRLAVWAHDFSPALVIFPVVRGQQVRSLVIELSPSQKRRVGGQVVGPDGKTGVAGARVSFRLEIHPPPPPGATGFGYSWRGDFPHFDYQAVTDENGHFGTAVPAPAGPQFPQFWKVTVEAEGYLSRSYQGFQIASDGWQSLTLQLFHGGRLSGTVRLANSSLPANLSAALYDNGGWLGAPTAGGGGWVVYAPVSPQTGRFDFGLVEPGEHRLTVHIPAQPDPRAKVVVREGESLEVNLKSPPGVVLKGRVVNAQTGRPIPGAGISAARREGAFQDDAVTRSDQFGFYRLSPLEPGEIDLYVTATGMAALRQTARITHPGLEVLNFRLSPAPPPAGTPPK